jgi:hypothetical protein
MTSSWIILRIAKSLNLDINSYLESSILGISTGILLTEPNPIDDAKSVSKHKLKPKYQETQDPRQAIRELEEKYGQVEKLESIKLSPTKLARKEDTSSIPKSTLDLFTRSFLNPMRTRPRP